MNAGAYVQSQTHVLEFDLSLTKTQERKRQTQYFGFDLSLTKNSVFQLDSHSETHVQSQTQFLGV